MNFELESINCNLCGESDAKLYAQVSYIDYLNRRPELRNENDPILKNDKLAGYKFSLVRCRHCGLIYVNPRLSDRSLAQLYGKEYFSFYADTESEAHKKRQETFRTEIIELEKLTMGRKLLDVGCGGGAFLNSLGNSWEKWGTEINAAGAEYGIANFGLNVRQGTLKEASFPNESFDVVKLRAVIEHLYDPTGELHEIYRILKKDGIVAVQTPNMGSICAKLYREKFRMVCPVHHIYYFSTKTLTKILTKVGFKVVRVSYHYFDTPYASIRDPLKILLDLATFRILRKPDTVSPPFYGNIVDIYAQKAS